MSTSSPSDSNDDVDATEDGHTSAANSSASLSDSNGHGDIDTTAARHSSIDVNLASTGSVPQSDWLKCCFTSTETVGLLGTGAQDVHLDFHTASELWVRLERLASKYKIS